MTFDFAAPCVHVFRLLRRQSGVPLCDRGARKTFAPSNRRSIVAPVPPKIFLSKTGVRGLRNSRVAQNSAFVVFSPDLTGRLSRTEFLERAHSFVHISNQRQTSHAFLERVASQCSHSRSCLPCFHHKHCPRLTGITSEFHAQHSMTNNIRYLTKTPDHRSTRVRTVIAAPSQDSVVS